MSKIENEIRRYQLDQAFDLGVRQYDFLRSVSERGGDVLAAGKLIAALTQINQGGSLPVMAIDPRYYHNATRITL